ncbi:MAG: hypothetical protein ACOZCL_08755 [Bacillota bacterium]
MKIFTKLLICIIAVLMLSSCSDIKEGVLVTIENTDGESDPISQSGIESQFVALPQGILIEKNASLLKEINTDLTPIAITPDYNYLFAYEVIPNEKVEEENSKVILGNLKQEVILYIITASNKEKKQIGKFLSLKDFEFDESGKLLAFLDGNSNIYIYDIAADKLDLIREGSIYSTYSQISWSKNSKSIMLDTWLNIDIALKELISYVVETPYIKAKINNTEYIVQMKNASYDDMIAIYDFNKKVYSSLANGIYLDSDDKNIIYANNDMTSLNLVRLDTYENKNIEEGPIYSAKILKSTGEIVYTTLNHGAIKDNRYLLVKANPVSGGKRFLPVSSPTFYLSPAEDMLYFVSDYSQNSLKVDIASFTTKNNIAKKENEDIRNIKTVILQMLDLDYTFKGNYDEYLKRAKELYTNTDAPVPQEALENKLIDFKRFNAPIPNNQKKETLPHTLKLQYVNFNGDTASVNIGLPYVNALEMVKQQGCWYITGFSTHPYSNEVQQVKEVVQSHLKAIIEGNRIDALKYWDSDSDSEITKTQIKIVDELIANKSSYTFEIGEIELWNYSEFHRVERSEASTNARVKIIIKTKTDIYKYKLTLTRVQRDNFEIESWSTDPLSISQYF